MKWFSLPDDSTNNDFTIQHLFDTSVEITKNLYPSYDINNNNIKSEIEFDKQIKGKYFIHLIDILKILFGNIFDHNKQMLTVHELDIVFRAKEMNGSLRISISNNLSDNLEIEELCSKIVDTTTLLENKEYIINKSIQEKGSGYPKIMRILTYFFGANGHITPHVNINKFCVDLDIDYNSCFILEVEHENSYR
jgi:hypothetical protein